MKRILVVDDDETILVYLELVLTSQGYSVESFSDPVKALNRLMEQDFELLISDYVMNEVNGVHLLDFARQIKPRCERILLTGNSSEAMLKSAINNAHIFKFLEKPIDTDILLSDVAQALAHQELVEEAHLLRAAAADS